RITEMKRVSRGSLGNGSARHQSTSIAFGSMRMRRDPATGRTARATMPLTALCTTFHREQPSTLFTTDATGTRPGIAEWYVITVGMPARYAAHAAASATGETILT